MLFFPDRSVWEGFHYSVERLSEVLHFTCSMHSVPWENQEGLSYVSWSLRITLKSKMQALIMAIKKFPFLITAQQDTGAVSSTPPNHFVQSCCRYGATWFFAVGEFACQVSFLKAETAAVMTLLASVRPQTHATDWAKLKQGSKESSPQGHEFRM